ncbi:putative transporter [Colletotrichum sp. SAR 10_98]|nr:putative transporter [Colletotrichum sp. SAR 10_98]
MNSVPKPALNEVSKQGSEEIENVPAKNLTLMDTYRSYSPEFSKETERQLVRKIDAHLLPLIVIIYLFNYLDRNSITQARLYGLQEDTHVKGATYQTAISIFSAGYIAMQLPSTMLMTKMQPHIFLPGCIIIWAIWLSEEEKVVAQGRLAADAGSEEVLGEDEISMKQAILAALADYRVWLFALLQMSTTASISFSHFFPTLIQQLGFKNNTIVLLLTAPPYFFSFIWALTLAWDADRRQKRSPHASISAITAIAGTVTLVVMGDQRWARYVMTFLVSAGTFGIYSTTYPWLSSTIVQPAVKRAAAIGIANTLANSASLFANFFWLDEYGPSFRVSWACILAFQVLGLCCICGLRICLKKANHKFERLRSEVDQYNEEAMNRLDKDSQRAVLNGFRYIT